MNISLEDKQSSFKEFAWLGIALSVMLLLWGAAGATGTTTFDTAVAASEDTYVKNTRANNNYGARLALEADTEPSVKRILLRFHVTGIPEGATVASANLRMFTVDRSNLAGTVHRVSGNWSEASVTWSNAPVVGESIADVSGPAVVGTWREADVTAAVPGNGEVDFYVVTTSTDGVDYASRETATQAPILIVRWSAPLSSPSPTDAPPTASESISSPTPTVLPASPSTATPSPTPSPTPAPTATGTPVPAAGPAAGAIRAWHNANSAFDQYTRDSSFTAVINARYNGMLVYESYFDSRLSWYQGMALFYKDAYAIYTDPTRNKDGATADWALRDAAGNICYIPYGSPYDQYAADVGNQAFRNNWISYVANKLSAYPGYEGVFVDDVNLDISRVACGSNTAPKCNAALGTNCPIDPRTGQVMTNEDWKRYLTEFMEQVRAALPGKQIAHNSIWYVTAQDDPYLIREIQSANIIEMEQGFLDGGLTGGTGKYSWVSKMKYVDLVHAYGAIVIDRDEDVFDDNQQLYGVANYLLLNLGLDFYDPTYKSSPVDPWNLYGTNLGTAINSRYQWNGLWRRDFMGGFVIVNPPGGTTTTVDLGAQGTRTLGARQAVIIAVAP